MGSAQLITLHPLLDPPTYSHTPWQPQLRGSGHGHSGDTKSNSLTDQQLPRLQKQLWEKNLQFRTFIIYRFFPAHGEEIASIPFLGNTLPRGTELLQHSMGTSRAGGRIQGGFLSGGYRELPGAKAVRTEKAEQRWKDPQRGGAVG